MSGIIKPIASKFDPLERLHGKKCKITLLTPLQLNSAIPRGDNGNTTEKVKIKAAALRQGARVGGRDIWTRSGHRAGTVEKL